MRKKIMSLLLSFGVLLSCLGITGGRQALAQTAAPDASSASLSSGDEGFAVFDSYAVVRAGYEQKGYPLYAGEPLSVDLAAGAAEGALDLRAEYEGRQNVLMWPAELAAVEWSIEVPESALYEVEVTYLTCNDSSAAIQRSLSVDGEIPYNELNNLFFSRQYRDDGSPRLNTAGDEMAPQLEEIHAWQTTRLWDYDGLYDEPLRLYLEAGTHTLRLEQIGSQPMALGGIRLVAAEKLPTYEQVKASYEQNGCQPAGAGYTLQAENTLYKSDSVLRQASSAELSCLPQGVKNTVINVIGGSNWAKANQSITWELDVPETGLYKLAFHSYQYYSSGLPVYRQLQIDGAIPFEECRAVAFDADKDWGVHTVSGESGDPCWFYLEEGPHTLTLTVKAGALSGVVRRVEEDMDTLSALYLRITMLTGSDPDVNYDYQLETRIPELLDTFRQLRQGLQDNMAVLDRLCPETKPMLYNQMKSMQAQYTAFEEDVFSIPSKLDEFTNLLTQYGNWVTSLKAGGMQIDEIQLLPPSQEPATRPVSLFRKLYAGAVNFLYSFFKDYSGISGAAGGDTEIRSTIEVWFGSGQAWGVELKDMIDSQFTPETGIQVRMNIVPSGQIGAGGINAMMLSIISGRGPDAVLGLAGSSVAEYAMRNTAADLSAFPDFEQARQGYLDSSFLPLTYQGKVYGFPETVNFMVMAYRKDILANLGIRLPETWDEMYREVVPVLAENNMQLSSSPGLVPLLHQHGGRLYTDDLLYTGLDSPEAYDAFVQHCEFYTLYGVPVNANFFNRFRSGEMPVGFVDLSAYMQFATAAPELAGRWGIALLPGIEQDDGTVNHDMGGVLTNASMILAQSENQADAWEFIKWWMSTETQVEYGSRVEGAMGEASRVASANMEAFEAMNWNPEHLSVLKEAFKYTTDYPAVLGSYFTTRHINYAFNRVVVSKTQSERDALEEAVEDINQELKRRREGNG